MDKVEQSAKQYVVLPGRLTTVHFLKMVGDWTLDLDQGRVDGKICLVF